MNKSQAIFAVICFLPVYAIGAGNIICPQAVTCNNAGSVIKNCETLVKTNNWTFTKNMYVTALPKSKAYYFDHAFIDDGHNGYCEFTGLGNAKDVIVMKSTQKLQPANSNNWKQANNFGMTKVCQIVGSVSPNTCPFQPITN